MLIQELIKRRTLVLDGALGTQLEEIIPKDSEILPQKHPLWSGIVLMRAPDLIKQVHMKYLAAGCDLLLTSTYQLSYEGLNSYSPTSLDSARQTWKQSVAVASEAIAESGKSAYILGSIGPYGASLGNGAEYTGCYGSASTIERLKEHHRPLLECFSTDQRVSAIAFETIPNFTEITAIVELLTELTSRGTLNKEFLLSFNLKDVDHLANGDPIGSVIGYLNEAISLNGLAKYFIGIGINCVSCSLTADLIDELNKYNHKSFPLIVYPNFGVVVRNGADGYVLQKKSGGWEAAVDVWYHKPNVRIIGGCCSTGPAEIEAITSVIKKYEAINLKD